MEGSKLRGSQEEKNWQWDFFNCLQELSRTMEVIEEHIVQEDQRETSMATEKECMCISLVVHCLILYVIFTTCSLIPNLIIF